MNPSDMAVPRAAPAIPRPAPGIMSFFPKMIAGLVGKIKIKLKNTLRKHPTTLRMLGVLILPLHWSIPEDTPHRCMSGRAAPKIRKYVVEPLAIVSFPPSQKGRLLLIARQIRAIVRLKHKTAIRPCFAIPLALASFLAPIEWAT